MGTVRRQYRSGSISQRKDGMWIGRYDVGTDANGKRRRVVVSATTESRCKEKLEDKKREIARMGVPERLSGRAATVESWSQEWLKLIVSELRPGAYRTTASTVKVWINPTIGRKRLTTLTPADIRAVFDAQRKAGKSQGTRIRTHTDIMSMLKAAILEGHDVPQRVLFVKRPKPGENDREAIPLDESIALLRVIEAREDKAKWVASLLNGIRQAERLGLTWDCIDFENDLIDISWQLQPLPYIDPKNKAAGFRTPDGYVARPLVEAMNLVRPKSKSSIRKIPMVPWVRAALLEWRESAPSNPYGLVWTSDAGKPIRAEADRADWYDIQDAADVRHPSGRRYVGHESRHATATLLLELGIPKDVVTAILGQSKFVETYDHADRLPKARAALIQLADQLQLTS